MELTNATVHLTAGDLDGAIASVDPDRGFVSFGRGPSAITLWGGTYSNPVDPFVFAAHLRRLADVIDEAASESEIHAEGSHPADCPTCRTNAAEILDGAA